MPSEIVPNLYLGSASDSQNLELLIKLQVTHILNVKESAVLPDSFLENDQNSYLHLPLSNYGDSSLLEILEEVCAYIQGAIEKKGNVLVHCQYGCNRSPAVVAAYLIHYRGFSCQAAIDLICKKRKQVGICQEYLEQLKNLADKSSHT
jgi:protein-tyrosine phosphatase